MKIITGSSKVVQGTGETQVATVLLIGAEGSKEKQMRERLIIQGVVLRDAGIPEAGLLGVGEVEVFGGGREGEGEAVFRVVDLVVLRAGARGAG